LGAGMFAWLVFAQTDTCGMQLSSIFQGQAAGAFSNRRKQVEFHHWNSHLKK
jgi:hypothetical protein